MGGPILETTYDTDTGIIGPYKLTKPYKRIKAPNFVREQFYEAMIDKKCLAVYDYDYFLAKVYEDELLLEGNKLRECFSIPNVKLKGVIPVGYVKTVHTCKSQSLGLYYLLYDINSKELIYYDRRIPYEVNILDLAEIQPTLYIELVKRNDVNSVIATSKGGVFIQC